MIESDSTIYFVVLGALLLAHAFIAAAKEAITFTRKARRVQLIEDGHPSAKIVDKLAEDIPLLTTTEQLMLKFIAALTVLVAIVAYADKVAQSFSIGYTSAAATITVVVAAAILIFGDLIPRGIARTHAESVAFLTVGLFAPISLAAMPISKLVSKILNVLAGRWNQMEEVPSNAITEDDIRSYVDAGEEEGVLKEEEKEMIYSIFSLGDTTAREVMVPRIDIVGVEADASLSSALETILKAGHSRVPVFEDTIDNITGILYVKDLFKHWLKEGTPDSIRGLERSVYYVPETKPVIDLLKELQTKKVHIAIVVDEYGGTAGLATIEDILEEIVGEIQDEHDAEEFYMQFISDDEYIFSARMDLDDINEIMSIELPTDESDTLGGLIYDALGRIPKSGETVTGAAFDMPEVLITVLDVEGRRIKTARIKVTRKKPERFEQERSEEEFQASVDKSSNSSSKLVSNVAS